MALLSKAAGNQALLNMSLGVLNLRNRPRSPAFMRVAGVLQGRLSNWLIRLIQGGISWFDNRAFKMQ